MSIANTTNGLSQAIIRILWGVYPLVGLGLIIGNILAHVIACVLLIFLIRPIIREISWSSLSYVNIKKLHSYIKIPLI